MIIHCFFEQSGIFKNEFKKLGYQSYDYDILNDFGETDYIIDLFSEIENAYLNKFSLFDKISSDDLIFAFFPCTRFSAQAYMLFQCTQKQLKNLDDLSKLDKVINFHTNLSYLYTIICKLFSICLKRNLKLIVENPYSSEHYLTRYFPIKPTIIDYDRTFRGDYYKKPTQYWFINLKPKNNFIFEPITVLNKKTISLTSSKVERSLISKFYAERFIKEFIL